MAASDNTFFLVYVGSTDKERYAKISPQDAELVLKYKWSVTSTRKYGERLYYARTNVGPRNSRKALKMHRLIMNAPDGVHVDHINGDGLDNRRENLRIATAQQNSANSRKPRGCLTSKFKGVAWHKNAGKWRAYIAVNRGQRHLGLYDDEIEAARAYDAKAREVWGEFANLNLA